MIEDQLIERIVLFDEDAKVTLLVVRSKLDRASNVALAVRRSLEQLTEFGAIALGPAHVSAGFEHEQFRLLPAVLELPAMGDVPVDNYIVSLRIGQVTIH